MFANQRAVKYGDESARQSPDGTLDMKSMFGAGTLQEKDSGAGMQERSLQVQITNPGMRNNYGAAERVEKQRITARSMDVVARSGNQRPSEVVDSAMDHSFIWGQVGEGEDIAPEKPSMVVNGLLVVGALACAWWMLWGDKDKD